MLRINLHEQNHVVQNLLILRLFSLDQVMEISKYLGVSCWFLVTHVGWCCQCINNSLWCFLKQNLSNICFNCHAWGQTEPFQSPRKSFPLISTRVGWDLSHFWAVWCCYWYPGKVLTQICHWGYFIPTLVLFQTSQQLWGHKKINFIPSQARNAETQQE